MVTTEEQLRKCTKCLATKCVDLFCSGNNRARCKQCMAEYNKKYQDDNAAAIKTRRELYWQENKHRFTEGNLERSKLWTLANPERAAENRRAWTKENIEKVLKQSRDNHAKHREKRNAKAKAWQKAHPEIFRDSSRKRRAIKVMAGDVHFSEFEFNLLKIYFFNTCVSCHRPEWLVNTLEADHIIPLAMGGSDAILNIQPLCRSCNASKYTKSIDFREHFTKSVCHA